ncbi:MAG: hypothetical protein O3B37_03300 [Proteobacteria bacterium]|nr:hypothetical protein [Pseudomonadota bacterium]
MKTLNFLLMSVSIMTMALVIGIPATHAQDKPTCSVRDGVDFHRQKNYGKAFECW